jgi:hypothetical protein
LRKERNNVGRHLSKLCHGEGIRCSARQKPTKSHSPTAADRLRAFLRVTGRWITIAFDAVLEARAQRAMIEAQLYLNRCKHTSKNDDDLPVLR